MALAIQPASVHAQVLIGTATTPAVGCYSLSNGGSCRGMFSDRNSLGSAFASYRLATCFSFRTAVSRVADLRPVAFRAVVMRAVLRLTVLRRPPVLRPAVLHYPPSNQQQQPACSQIAEPAEIGVTTGTRFHCATSCWVPAQRARNAADCRFDG